MSIFEENLSSRGEVTTEQLAQILGGGDCFIRSRAGKVTGMAIRLDLNPEAPSRILVGRGPRLESLSKKFVDADEFLPVYLKLATNRWSFLGNYKAEKFDTDSGTVERYRMDRTGELCGVLFLVGESSLDELEERAETGFVQDAARRKEIEKAAVNYVIEQLKNSKTYHTVESVESKNLGFDILALSNGESRKIEVKGTSSNSPAFFLSANEYRASQVMSGWELRVVTEADTNPNEYIYSPSEMKESFNLEPMAFRCELKSQ